MFKIVFMGTPEFAVPALRSLVKNHAVLAVYTQPDKPAQRGMNLIQPPVKKCALELNIPVFQPEKLSEVDVKRIREYAPDFLIVAAYGHILKNEILTLPKINAINIHSSLLPRWRGAAPIQWAILEGDASSGVSIMKMVAKLDAGEVYGVRETKISRLDTAQTLHDRLSLLGAEALEEVLESYKKSKSGGIPAVKQEESKVTYAKKLTKEMEILNPFKKTALELDRHIRAFTPWPGTSLFIEKLGRIKIKKAHIIESDSLFSQEPGVLESKNQNELVLSTLKGHLSISVLQEEGKKEMAVNDFLNGLKGRNIPPVFKVIQNEDKK